MFYCGSDIVMDDGAAAVAAAVAAVFVVATVVLCSAYSMYMLY